MTDQSARPKMLQAFLRDALVVVLGELDNVDDQAKVRALVANCDMGERSVVDFILEFLERWDAAMLTKLREVAHVGSAGIVKMSSTWHCPHCGCRNLPEQERCYCGEARP